MIILFAAARSRCRYLLTELVWGFEIASGTTRCCLVRASHMTEIHHGPNASQSPRALAGIRVLDVTQFMAGPFCSTILADLGADVIKIEPPSGDATRQMVGAKGTESPSFNAVNRGKRSVVLNLKTAEGQRIFTQLAGSSDILSRTIGLASCAGSGSDTRRWRTSIQP